MLLSRYDWYICVAIAVVSLVFFVVPSCTLSRLAGPGARSFGRAEATVKIKEVLTRPNRVVCADTAAKGVSAGSAESMIGYRRLC